MPFVECDYENRSRLLQHRLKCHTTSSGTNQIKLAYNVDGSLSQRTDQRGVVIAYSYTNNRLASLQSVTTVPTGVDGTVQSIARTYDSLNRVQNITSYGSTGGTGTVVNDIQYAYYNGTEKVATSYQSHSGAVNTSTTLNVQYTYDTTTNGSIYSNQLRLQTEIHPNSRAIYYDYGSSGSSTEAYNATSTVREIWDGSPSGTGLGVYDYNGAGSRLAIATYPQPSFKLDHFEGTSGTYAGMDRFGRIIDQYWAGFSGVPDVDRIHYAYDYDGNRTYRQIDPAIYPTENMDQAYTYDALHRLLTSQVGTLSGATISGTPASEEDWTLDGLGNWAGYVTKASGTVNLNQTRTATTANEISGISASVGSTWATPAYDLAGNMTTIPAPSLLTSTYTATYDAWNRLVSLASGSTTIAAYSYDGLHRRIVKGIYAGGAVDHNEHAYFSERWQILEVRKEVSGTTNTNPFEQYVWHSFYLDAPVLRDYDATMTGSPTRYYYTFDANYNITAATNNTGSSAERYYYSPYGPVAFLGASFNVLSGSSIANSMTYAGRHLDFESGLLYYRTRLYHGHLGTFISRDALSYGGGDLNVYKYVDDRPTVGLDPFGRCNCGTKFTPSTCCKIAQSNDTRTDVAATVVCCQGQKIDCIYESGGGAASNNRAIAIIDFCMLAHESCHHYQVNCQQDCLAYPAPLWIDSAEGECQCNQRELTCYLALLPDCHNDPGCLQELRDRARFVLESIRTNCHYNNIAPLH